MKDPGDDRGPVDEDDATTSATDDSSVGFGNRPEEFLEDTSPHDDGTPPLQDVPSPLGGGPGEEPAIDKERDIDSRKTDSDHDD
jgi:hypothetical protein